MSDLALRRNPRVLWRRVHDGVLLLAPSGDAPVLASGAAATVWFLLGDDGATPAELRAAVVADGLPAGAPADGGVGDAVALLRSVGALGPSEAAP